MVLADRYRVLGLIGKGGMGEVYRADDLKLGQPVALKFLPEALASEPGRLMAFLSEVRLARQVSHPNVVRMYDVGELEGQHFLSMEYVDGEDLASLLRRIGRVPPERALTLARELCGGLAAAHARGVLHRDLKPANVMVDGGGRVRLADFGLAGLSDDRRELRAGTPAYMAPEQLAGGAATVHTDVFALGLVLYELFTGKRAIDVNTLPDLVRWHEGGQLTPPRHHTPDMDPAIERAILRCLAHDPAKRPVNALSVAASLPGGDPLAAALAAGETPSPELVAAAAESRAIHPLLGLGLVAATALGLIALMWMGDRVLLLNRVPLTRPPAVLQDRAQELLVRLGYGETRTLASAWGMAVNRDYLRFVEATDNGPNRWARLALGRPYTALFWYRTSPRPLVPIDDWRVQSGDPPLSIAGMTTVLLDPTGRLAELHILAPQLDDGTGPAPDVDWRPLFEAAGLDAAALQPVPPGVTPRGYADIRAAWRGSLPEQPDVQVRVEAAAYQGRPVSFFIMGPGARPSRQQPAPVSAVTALLGSGVLVAGFVGLIASALLARANLRAGRGDRQGATRAALALLTIGLASWVLLSSFTPTIGAIGAQLHDGLATSALASAVLALGYLALEPYVRRFWPDSLSGWTRLLSGRLYDARVGRDVLTGVSIGLALSCLEWLRVFLPPAIGQPPPAPLLSSTTQLLSLRAALGTMVERVGTAALNAMVLIFVIVALRLLVRHARLASALAFLLFSLLTLGGALETGPLTGVPLSLVASAVLIGTTVRFGLLTLVATFLVNMLATDAPMTLRWGAWHADASLASSAVVLGLACYGYAAARAGEPLFTTRADDALPSRRRSAPSA